MNRSLARNLVAGLALGLILAGTAHADRGQPAGIDVPAYITKALTDPARAHDRANDARRRPGPILALAGVKPGDTVIELVPASGYWTRILSRIVGPKGHVYAVTPVEFLKVFPKAADKVKVLAADPHYSNVTALVQPAADLKIPKPADLVFTAENMHDYNNASFGSLPPKALATEVLKALKPGGIFLVNDHVAPKGSGLSDTDTLHRIDPATVKAQVTAAGFVFVGASDVLRNPKDPHDIKVFDPSIRGHTDQFVYKFRKP
ncbi:class I SAM-dependent methyltransferase [Oleiagrimonas citrea]|uniref:Class I SAM-dependent methyltransferase n=1 Tax=Oleiagrimonas citrea TaxID=1665687 RepID=A0A846ZJ21_9GAMM|nr:class I SAM-dependent methyltransferase [Oleiagrimonas citrea]NKZ37520.1 class I SAM-dependent methyltransferase [Oleiagrimonas citrea]